MARKSKKKQPSFPQIVAEEAAKLSGVIETDVFFKHVEERYHSKTKSLRNRFIQHIKMDGSDILTRVGKKHLIPTHLAMKGVRYRLLLTQLEMENGMLILDLAFTRYFSHRSEPSLSLFNSKGEAIEASLKNYETTFDGLSGPEIVEIPAIDMHDWFDQEGFQPGDCIIVTVLDWKNLHFQMEREPVGQWTDEQIAEQNKLLADALFDQLESSRDDRIFTPLAIPAAYAQIPKDSPCPPDCWPLAIYKDGRMETHFSSIEYRTEDAFGLELQLSRWLNAGLIQESSPTAEESELTEQELQQVYRFRAAFKHRKNVWREIEIQGQHTLADFDNMLRLAFQHDTWGHLSGFWKRIPKGSGKRKSYREVDLGNINPFGGGDAADIQIAELQLQEQEQLKYVYDFGDWVEHIISIESIESPKEGVEYPRISGQNKARKRYCPECKEQGRKEVATLLCITCSNEQGKSRYLCEECAQEHLDYDHYVEEARF